MRFVIGDDAELLFDLRQRAPGRGMSVCPHLRCLDAAAAGAFRKAAKQNVNLPEAQQRLEWLRQRILPGLLRRAFEILQAGARAAQIVVGAQNVESASRADLAAALILASDASPGSAKKYTTNAARKDIPVFSRFDRATLGRAFAREEAVLAVWKDTPLFREYQEIERILALFDSAPARPAQPLTDKIS